MRRLHWPIMVAVLETDDPAQLQWLRQRLAELRQCHTEIRWANEIVDEVLAQQDASKGEYVNLAELLRNRVAP